MFPNDTPSLSELVARVEALEEAKIAVNDLPLAELIRKIELLGLDASTIDTPTSYVTGVGTWTWPGAQSASSAIVVQHGMPAKPSLVLALSATDQGPNEALIGETFSYTTTAFSTRGVSKVGTAYPAGTTASFNWIAFL